MNRESQRLVALLLVILSTAVAGIAANADQLGIPVVAAAWVSIVAAPAITLVANTLPAILRGEP